MNSHAAILEALFCDALACRNDSAERNFTTTNPRDVPIPVIYPSSSGSGSNEDLKDIADSAPRPPFRKIGQAGRVRRDGLLVLASTFLLRLPSGAAFDQGALQEFVGRLKVAAPRNAPTPASVGTSFPSQAALSTLAR